MTKESAKITTNRVPPTELPEPRPKTKLVRAERYWSLQEIARLLRKPLYENAS